MRPWIKKLLYEWALFIVFAGLDVETLYFLAILFEFTFPSVIYIPTCFSSERGILKCTKKLFPDHPEWYWKKKVMSTQGKGFNYAGSEKKQSALQMFLLTTDDLIENAIENNIVLTLPKKIFFASELFFVQKQILHFTIRSHPITTWIWWGGRALRGSKISCFCVCSGYKNCPHKGGEGLKNDKIMST